MSSLVIRIRFYIGWMVAESVNNASGLGFNGYENDGSAKWDLNSNIKFVSFSIFFMDLLTDIKNRVLLLISTEF